MFRRLHQTHEDSSNSRKPLDYLPAFCDLGTQQKISVKVSTKPLVISKRRPSTAWHCIRKVPELLDRQSGGPTPAEVWDWLMRKRGREHLCTACACGENRPACSGCRCLHRVGPWAQPHLSCRQVKAHPWGPFRCSFVRGGKQVWGPAGCRAGLRSEGRFGDPTQAWGLAAGCWLGTGRRRCGGHCDGAVGAEGWAGCRAIATAGTAHAPLGA